MRHLLVSSSGDRLPAGLRARMPPGAVLLSARGVDRTLETLARSSRVDAVVTDDPGVEAAIRAEMPGAIPVLLVGRRAGPRAVARALGELLGGL